MKQIWRHLGSVRLTAWLMVALVALFLLGSFIPQKSLLGKELYLRWKAEQPGVVSILEGVRLTDIYRSPLAYGLLGLFFLNLLSGMAARAGAIWRRCALPDLPSADSSPGPAARQLANLDLAGLARQLQRSGYRVRTGTDSLVAVKYRWAPLATFLFHVGFLLLLAGGAATFYTRFRAEADLAVGETFTGEYTRVLRKPLLGSVPPSHFTVREVVPHYYQRRLLTDLQLLVDDERGTHRCGINAPYQHGSLSFVINRIDVAPLVVLRNATGDELDGAYVKLKVIDGKPDSFTLQGYTVTARLLPNLGASADKKHSPVNRAGSDRTLSQPLIGNSDQDAADEERELVDPAFDLTVSDPKGTQVASGILRPGQKLSLGTTTLQIDGLTYWVHFYAGAERGLAVVYGAFVCMVAALLLRFGLPRREIRATLQGAGGWLEGRSEYFPTLFQTEIERLAAHHQGERP